MNDNEINLRDADCCVNCKYYKPEPYETFGDCELHNITTDECQICNSYERTAG